MLKMRSPILLPLLLLLSVGQSTAFVPNGQAGLQQSSAVISPATAFSRHAVPTAKKPSLISKTALAMAETDNGTASSPSFSFNPLYAFFWLAFLGFAAVGPGELFDPKDTALITQYIENPSNPGFSELFQAVFNYLGLMPAILACIAVPQGTNRGLPAAPFFAASFAMGYGAVGPYLTFRAPPKDEVIPSEVSWFTRNVLDNKLFNWATVAAVVALPFSVGLVDAVLQDPSATLQSYQELFATSKLVSASSVDAMILNIVAATLIGRDLQLRDPTVDSSKANLIGAATLLAPFLGASLYCALRPSLPSEE